MPGECVQSVDAAEQIAVERTQQGLVEFNRVEQSPVENRGVWKSTVDSIIVHGRVQQSTLQQNTLKYNIEYGGAKQATVGQSAAEYRRAHQSTLEYGRGQKRTEESSGVEQSGVD